MKNLSNKNSTQSSKKDSKEYSKTLRKRHLNLNSIILNWWVAKQKHINPKQNAYDKKNENSIR